MALTGGWGDARRILAVRLDNLGDVVMMTPALHAIRSNARVEELVLLTSPSGAAAAPLLADVDDVVPYDAPWVKNDRTPDDPELDHRLIGALAARRFDAAVIFSTYSQSALPAAMAAYLAGIPRRLAYSRENPYGLLTDHVPETEPDAGVRHEVRRQLDLVAAVGFGTDDDRLRLCVPPPATDRARSVLAGIGVRSDRDWVVVHPGASASSRRYPPEMMAEVVRLLSARGIDVVLAGTPADADVASSIVAAAAPAPIRSLVGALDLAGYAALAQAAPLVIANNSGPAHVAAAVGTSVVCLYALTNPQHEPWGVPARVLSHDVECRWCYRSVCPQGHHACLRGVPPADVARAALELLEMRPRAPLAARRAAGLVVSGGG